MKRKASRESRDENRKRGREEVTETRSVRQRNEGETARSKRRRRKECETARPRGDVAVESTHDVARGKRQRKHAAVAEPDESFRCRQEDCFDALPDDVVLLVLARLSSAATCPAHLLTLQTTCKRLKGLVLDPMVLSKASLRAISIKPGAWSESARRFLQLCVDAGNVEASYFLGMIEFYCLQNRRVGADLMARAATASHAAALYSLSIIQFNGSGGSRRDKDLRGGASLCARAAFLGHVDAIREMGHCLQDGYGVHRNASLGRRYIVEANARELSAALASSSTRNCSKVDAYSSLFPKLHRRHPPGSCPLLSDFGCNLPAPEPHPANGFLVGWFGRREPRGEGGEELRLCSHRGCGRPETRRHEFRRCSVCGAVNYCSRACQAIDWRVRHKAECAPMGGEAALQDVEEVVGP